MLRLLYSPEFVERLYGVVGAVIHNSSMHEKILTRRISPMPNGTT